MMKTIRLALATVVAAVAFSSCASYQKQVPVMGIGSNNINTYVAADLDYAHAKKIEGVVQTKTLFGFIQLIRNGKKNLVASNRYRGLNKTEQQALYRARETGNVDIVLDPEFDVEKHSWFFGAYKTKTVKVKGWGINIKGIKEDTHNNNGRGEFAETGLGGLLGK